MMSQTSILVLFFIIWFSCPQRDVVAVHDVVVARALGWSAADCDDVMSKTEYGKCRRSGSCSCCSAVVCRRFLSHFLRLLVREGGSYVVFTAVFVLL